MKAGPARPSAAVGAPVARLRAVERALAGHLDHPGVPPRLGAAMRYAVLSPGKRLRPLLALAACEAAGGPWRAALPAASAVEFVHAFSLVHDDLPAMDDDDFRRGRPTTHRRFDEATAILAGDALLSLAFEALLQLPARALAEAVRRLAVASGREALIAGQVLDLAAEGRRVGETRVSAIHERKTGALFGAALSLGGLAAGAPRRSLEALDAAGRHLGLAFQIRDDLLNAEAGLRQLGKRGGTDAARGKATYPAVVGAAGARTRAAAHLDLARAVLEEYGLLHRGLRDLLAAAATRTS